MTEECPSGRQIRLRHGRQRAVVVEVGGGLREYAVDDWHVLDGYAQDHMADGGRGQPLLPWPNRIADGHYTFDGDSLQIAIDEVAHHNAIHGLTRWRNWSLTQTDPATARAELMLYPQPGYPFTLRLAIEYALAADGLNVRTTAHNAGHRALPFGAGQHPYLSVGTPRVDDALLELPALARLELDEQRRIPTGPRLRVAESPLDFSTGRSIGALVIDECFTALARGADGLARALLTDPRGGRSVTLWMDEHYRYLQVFSGDTLVPERRRQGLALEPMTCPPNAFQTGIDLIRLQPGESVGLTWGLSPTPL